jgi:hypothetical protein
MHDIVVWMGCHPWLCEHILVLHEDGTLKHRWVAVRELTGEEIDAVQKGQDDADE